MINVLIVNNARFYYEALANVLGRVEGIHVVGMAVDRDESLSCVRELCPDIVLLDVALPESVVILRAIVDAAPGVKVVALGVSENEDGVVTLAEAGIGGYLPREGSLEDLVTTVQSVIRGEVLCSPRMAARLLRRVATLAADRHWMAMHRLTPREVEIVRLIERGLSNKEIARELSIGVRTAKNHVHNILEKLQVHRRSEAAARLRGARLTASGV